MRPQLQIYYLPDDSMQVDFYKYIDVCAVTKYLLHVLTSQELHLSQEAQFAECIRSYIKY